MTNFTSRSLSFLHLYKRVTFPTLWGYEKVMSNLGLSRAWRAMGACVDIVQKGPRLGLSWVSSYKSGLSPRGHLERQAELHASTQDEA